MRRDLPRVLLRSCEGRALISGFPLRGGQLRNRSPIRFDIGFPTAETIQVRSPTGPAFSIRASSGNIGIVTRVPVFSVSFVMTSLRTCCLPRLAASPRRKTLRLQNALLGILRHQRVEFSIGTVRLCNRSRPAALWSSRRKTCTCLPSRSHRHRLAAGGIFAGQQANISITSCLHDSAMKWR